MDKEGAASECSIVTIDCLSIIRNTLNQAKICQQIYYSMSSSDTSMRLLQYFDVEILDQLQFDDNELNDGVRCWAQHPNRLYCAITALLTLSASLGQQEPNDPPAPPPLPLRLAARRPQPAVNIMLINVN